MKPFFIFTLLLFSLRSAAQTEQKAEETGIKSKPAFSINTKIVSFGIGFPNLYRMNYDEPSGFTHLKTSGFGPLYAKFEVGAFDHVGLVVSFGYSTFHYSYYGYSPQVVHYDDVNTLSLGFSGNYHFTKWIKNPKLDLYAGAGVAVDYQKLVYGNIPPFKEPERKAHIYPVVRAGARYYLDRSFGVFAEGGYDGLSLAQLGFSVRF